MTYKEYLESQDLLGRGFSYREIVAPWSYRKQKPPRDMWCNMTPTLRLAHDLRSRMIARGASGLRVVAASRPYGGARRSAHKRNAALDLDLLRSDRLLAGAYYEEAAILFSECASPLGLGLGFYGWGDGRQGIRVHIDTGRPRPATWWHHKGKSRTSPVWELIEGLDLESHE